MTQETFKLLILGLPGIVCYFVCQKIIGKPKRTAMDTILLVFIYAALAYVVPSIVHGIANAIIGNGFNSCIVDTLLNPEKDITIWILLVAASSGFILAYILAYFYRNNILNRVGQYIKATKRFGDQDVWHYFHNSSMVGEKHEWFIVRDLKTNLSYYGSIAIWSDSGECRELILYNVSVFENSTAEHLYDTQHLYLSRNSDEITIEIPPDDAESQDEYIRDTNTEEESNE